MNGAQAASAMDVVLDVAGRRIPRETGLVMLVGLGLSAKQADKLLGPVGHSAFIPDSEAPPRSLRGWAEEES